jgi:hypothetical protein
MVQVCFNACDDAIGDAPVKSYAVEPPRVGIAWSTLGFLSRLQEKEEESRKPGTNGGWLAAILLALVCMGFNKLLSENSKWHRRLIWEGRGQWP